MVALGEVQKLLDLQVGEIGRALPVLLNEPIDDGYGWIWSWHGVTFSIFRESAINQAGAGGALPKFWKGVDGESFQGDAKSTR
jgi:hypothetical protein